MAGALKHKERSHKTRNNNYSEFRRFEIRAGHNKYSKAAKNALAETIVAGIKKMFKRQAKGDK
jgi:hypothetical protein